MSGFFMASLLHKIDLRNAIKAFSWSFKFPRQTVIVKEKEKTMDF